MSAKMNFLQKLAAASLNSTSELAQPASQQQQLRPAASSKVICMSLREIGAQICPLILLAQMPISTEETAGYLKTRRNN